MSGEQNVEDSAVAEETPQTLSEALKEAQEKPKSVLWLIFLLSAFFCLGAYDFAVNVEENLCDMTYMFELPSYLQLRPLASSRKFPQYGLYVYGEGELVKDLKSGHFRGIPVLFIPGNSGSYKQVRSLASVALRKAMELSGYRTHFDYFSVDFNEEFSALYGGSLSAQSEFVSLSIDHILSLYPQEQGPKSVVLVGHSIGGLVAKFLLASPDFGVSKVNTLITLATPHEPVVVMDKYTRDFYDTIEARWNATRHTRLEDVTLVSIGGGERDIQVRSGLTSSDFADVHVTTTAVPGVWVSTDHRCIAWCKQLVLTINRALFDCIDHTTGQVTQDETLRKDIFKYHLTERNGELTQYVPSSKRHPTTTEFDKDGFWSDSLKRQFLFERAKVSENSHIMIRIHDDSKHRNVAVLAENFLHDNWIFGCKATTVYKNTRICSVGDNLSQLAFLLPSDRKSKKKSPPRRSVQLDMHALAKEEGYTHLLVFVPKGAEKIKVNIDVFNIGARSSSVTVPRWISFWKSYPLVEKTADKAVFYNVSLKELDQPWQAYDVSATALTDGDECQERSGWMKMMTPWANDAVYVAVGGMGKSKITTRLQAIRPASGETYAGQNPEVHLFLSPGCSYKLEINANVPAMWGQMVRFYAPMLLSFSLGVLMLSLAQQLRFMEKEKTFPSLSEVIKTRVTPISVVLPSRIIATMLASATVAPFVMRNDYQLLSAKGIDFGVLPILIFFIAIGVVNIISFFAWSTVVSLGSIVCYIVPSRFIPPPPAEADHGGNYYTLSKLPFLFPAALAALAASTCGALVICIGTFAHILRLVFDYARLKKADENGATRLRNSINFQLTLALVWAFSAVLNLPSLLGWTRNLGFAGGSPLSPDPSLLSGLVLTASAGVTWGGANPRERASRYGALAYAVQAMCVMTVLFGSVNLYRVNYFVSASLVLVCLHQLLSPDESVDVGEQERRENMRTGEVQNNSDAEDTIGPGSRGDGTAQE